MTIQLTGSTTATRSVTSHLGRIPAAAAALDLLVVVATVAIAYGSRRLVPTSVLSRGFEANEGLLVAIPAVVGLWLLAIFGSGGYRSEVFGAGLDEYKRVLRASALTAAVVGIAAYLLMLDLSRGFFLLTFSIGTPLLVGERWALRRVLQQARRVGRLRQRVLIAGTQGHVDEIATVLRRETWLGFEVIGAVVPGTTSSGQTALGIPLLGRASALAKLAEESKVDTVFLAGGAFESAVEMRRLAWDLEHHDVNVVIAPSVTDVAAERVRVRPVGGLPLIHLEKPRGRDALRLAKRAFDIVVTTVLLVAAVPFFAVAVVSIWRHDRGPLLFRQQRVGRNGDTFNCLKFRTMVVDAEARLAELHAQQGYAEGLFKMKDDPRITRPGAWLRRYSVDELPQLINVLRGDMSLVGPRPPLRHEVAQYDDVMARRLHVRPGMTGLWQVSGRSELSWSEAIRLDLYYVDNWSMLQDLVILFRTVKAVTGSRGAH